MISILLKWSNRLTVPSIALSAFEVKRLYHEYYFETCKLYPSFPLFKEACCRLWKCMDEN